MKGNILNLSARIEIFRKHFNTTTEHEWWNGFFFFFFFYKSCPTKSWNIGIKRNEISKQICQSQVLGLGDTCFITPMFGKMFGLSYQFVFVRNRIRGDIFFSCVSLIRFRKLDWFWPKIMWTSHLIPHCR